MKDLKTHLLESIKPPRLSAKNRDLWAPKPLDEKKVWEWLKNNITIANKRKVEIVDGKINVNGDVFVSNKGIEYFPYPFGEVTGYFNCEGCDKLKSLKNAPQRVGGYFSCSYCDNLTSLEGAPKEIGKNLYYYACGKKFTGEDVEKVCNVKGSIIV